MQTAGARAAKMHFLKAQHSAVQRRNQQSSGPPHIVKSVQIRFTRDGWWVLRDGITLKRPYILILLNNFYFAA